MRLCIRTVIGHGQARQVFHFGCLRYIPLRRADLAFLRIFRSVLPPLID
jgi:hypothetical protein